MPAPALMEPTALIQPFASTTAAFTIRSGPLHNHITLFVSHAHCRAVQFYMPSVHTLDCLFPGQWQRLPNMEESSSFYSPPVTINDQRALQTMCVQAGRYTHIYNTPSIAFAVGQCSVTILPALCRVPQYLIKISHNRGPKLI